jgi:hypothetical protein
MPFLICSLLQLGAAKAIPSSALQYYYAAATCTLSPDHGKVLSMHQAPLLLLLLLQLP